jgi:predicted glycoside hydrolase/deacetylase ChbG (UPF0249 family)
MACGMKFDEAVSLASGATSLSVGCHVVLVDGVPLLAPGQVSSLIDSGNGRCFRESIMSFARLAVTRRLDPAQIEAETTAQIQKLQAAGIQVSHLDSHKHIHMFPAALQGMLRAAKNCGIRAMRNPFEPLVFASLRQWKRQFQVKLLQGFRARFREMLADAGVKTPDGCVGIAVTGGLSLEIFQSLLSRLPEGTWEFVSHPGYSDAELDAIQTRLRHSRQKELEILTSPGVRELIEKRGIQLISYREL